MTKPARSKRIHVSPAQAEGFAHDLAQVVFMLDAMARLCGDAVANNPTSEAAATLETVSLAFAKAGGPMLDRISLALGGLGASEYTKGADHD